MPLRISALIAVFAVGLSAATPASQVALAEKFFRPPDFTRAVLSPDGTHVAYLIAKPNNLHALGLLEIATGAVRTAGRDKEDHVMQVTWLDADNLFVTYRLRGAVGRTRMVTMRRDTLEGDIVVDYPTQIAGVPRHTPTQPWITFNDGGTPAAVQIDGLGKLSPRKTGRERNLIRALEGPNRDVTHWLKDPDGEIRGCISRKGDEPIKVFWRPDPAKSEWALIPFDWKSAWPHIFNRQGQLVVVAAAGHKTTGVYYLDPASGKLGECLHRDEQQNLNNMTMLLTAKGDGIAGLRYDRERIIFVWRDAGLRGLQEFLDRQLPGMHNVVLDWDQSQSVFLLHSGSEQKPGSLLALDLKTRKMKNLGAAYPAVDAKTLAPTRVLDFTTRDGLKFNGYLTVPSGASAERPAPLVLVVPESPWERATARYSPMAQWLAANGFACLRADQRGGTDFPEDVGLARAADLRGAARDRLDAVRAAIQTGVVDAKRIAVLGLDLGARIALGAIAEEPGLFRCAALVNGAYDRGMYVDRLAAVNPNAHAAVQRQIKASPSAGWVPPIDELKDLRMAVLLTYDAPIDEVAKPHTWPARLDLQSRWVQRDFKKAGAAVELRPMTDAGETFDRLVQRMAGVGAFLKEKL